jgi:catechol 2,3-dioxygenase-like lactoylglutathione lyase family enzyme|tara:strand:- start:2183 stop:2752 length:570 start_codon:yes stop_codon:yes gene_type:complete
MSKNPHALFAHIGMATFDFDRMVEFYTRFFGMHVSDIKTVGPGRNAAWLTSDPNQHHQIVIVSGRPEDAIYNPVDQISFRANSLADVKAYWRAAKEENLKIQKTITHGNAWSVYFLDPENNRIEVYADTPWHSAQPHDSPLDFDLSDEELYRQTQEIVNRDAPAETFADWRKKTAEALKLVNWPIGGNQ